MKHVSMIKAPLVNVDTGSSYIKRIDNFILITDFSSSTDILGSRYNNFSLTTVTAKNIVSNIPDKIKLNSAFLSFGHAMSISRIQNLINIKMSRFSKSNFSQKIDFFKKTDGTSRLDLSMKDATEILTKARGRADLILISAGEVDMEKINIDTMKR